MSEIPDTCPICGESNMVYDDDTGETSKALCRKQQAAMTDSTPSARPEAQDVDLIEIAAEADRLAKNAFMEQPADQKPTDPDEWLGAVYRASAEAVLAAVTPHIERRARWKALEDVEDIAVTHAFRDTDGAAVVPFGILNDYIDNELAALDQEEST